MRAGIVTITKNLNFGNRLQNYALQEFLTKLGVEAETIMDVHGCKHTLELSLGTLLRLLLNIGKAKLEWKRRIKYMEFNHRYINFSDISVNYDKVPENLKDEYDYFIVGSDQVWNPHYKCTDFEFLTFAQKEKRISYAASFGVSELEDNKSERYKSWLNGMNYISVREQTGAEIVQKVTDRVADVLVDPTMLLTKKEWLKVAKKPRWYKDEQYILTYFLNEKPQAVRDRIADVAAKEGLKVIDLADKNNQDWYSIGPSEFIYLIAHCAIVYTDSFHGTVFSILFQVPFVSCEKVSRKPSDVMLSRIDTLLELFALQNRRGAAINGYRLADEFQINFEHVDEILDVEREKAKTYLQKAMALADETA